MLLRDFKPLIVAILEPELSARGFAFRSSSMRFTSRAAKGLTHSLHLLFSESTPFVRLDVHISLRLDRIEDIFHRTSGYEKRFRASTPTMGGALDAITGDARLRMLLDEERGPESARSLLVSPPMLSFYGEWFERFSRVENIDRELNDDPFRETPNRPMPWLRASTAMIVARLLHRSNYAALAAAYRELLGGFNDGFYLPRFELLLEDLAGIEA